jgi:hypothetical protein
LVLNPLFKKGFSMFISPSTLQTPYNFKATTVATTHKHFGTEERTSFSGKLPFRTTPEDHEALAQAAKSAGKSINQYMEDTLSEAAGIEPTPPPPSLSPAEALAQSGLSVEEAAALLDAVGKMLHPDD